MKISIITPTYNRADLIEIAIKSILNQTYQNFEMIIVDDGSTDLTLAVVSKYLGDSRIKFIESEVNGGVNKARNIGLQNISSDSELVTFLDSDDEFCSNALEDMINVIEKTPEINYFRFPVIYSDGRPACDLKLVGSTADFNAYLSMLASCGEWVVTLRRKIIENGFLYEESLNGGESTAYLRLSRKETVFFADKTVRIYHVGHDSLMKQNKNKKYFDNAIKGYSILLEDYGDELKKINNASYGLYCYTLGNFYFLNNASKSNIYNGLRYTIKGFKSNPFNLRLIRNNLNAAFSIFRLMIK